MGVQQIYADGSWQRSYDVVPGIIFGLKDITFYRQLSYIMKSRLWNMGISEKRAREAGYIDGAMLAFRRDVYEAVAGWDEEYFFYTEEADFCYRLKKAGYKIIFNPTIRIIHLRGGTTKDISVSKQFIKILLESKGTFYRKHYSKTASRAAIFLGIFFCLELLIIYSILHFFTFFRAGYKHKIAAMKDFIREWRNELKKI